MSETTGIDDKVPSKKLNDDFKFEQRSHQSEYGRRTFYPF